MYKGGTARGAGDLVAFLGVAVMLGSVWRSAADHSLVSSFSKLPSDTSSSPSPVVESVTVSERASHALKLGWLHINLAYSSGFVALLFNVGPGRW